MRCSCPGSPPVLGPQQREWVEPTSQLLLISPPPSSELPGWRIRYQFHLGSPDTLVQPLPLASRSQLGGHSSQQRAAVCRVGEKVTGGGEGGKHQPQEPGIAPSVGSSPALPGSRPLRSPRALLRPGLSNRGGHTGLRLQAQGVRQGDLLQGQLCWRN